MGKHAYFAYGSNMNLLYFQEWLARFGVQPEDVSEPQPAVLTDYRLRTNYLTTSSLGAANIEPCRTQHAEGVLLTLSSCASEVLRVKEGWPRRYEEICVEVVVGPGQQPIQAITYQVVKQHRLPFDVPVSREYRKLILDGAQSSGLSSEYMAILRETLRTPCMR